MRKIGFGISLIIIFLVIIYLARIFLVADQGITPYGQGFISGLLLILGLASFAAYFLGKGIFKSE
ncbi:MAG: hypothetical protein MK086_05910 [Flavobacteriales bacterium]|nr:hypothetical protein [Flavobacteriales bacterium]